jgi:outer membrane protein OmpA-like peptidoglycan-associated protein
MEDDRDDDQRGLLVLVLGIAVTLSIVVALTTGIMATDGGTSTTAGTSAAAGAPAAAMPATTATPTAAAPTAATPTAATPTAATAAAAPMATAPSTAPSAATPTAAPGTGTVKLYFETAQAALPAASSDLLRPLADAAKDRPGSRLVISGFHDVTGDAALNHDLAKNRAAAVRDALAAMGIEASRIEMRKPQETLGGADNREARRVEVSLE